MLSLEDDQIFARLHGVGLQAAMAVLLALFGMGSAMAQSIDQDARFGANTQATRDRVIAELRQARADGTIKRWSPVLLEVPFKAPKRGMRFAWSRQGSDGGDLASTVDGCGPRLLTVPAAVSTSGN